MNDIFKQIRDGAMSASLAEQIATILGVIGVWLAVRESLWNFPVGLVQVTIFGWVCFHGGLYSETALQGMFFLALVHGWVHWSRGDARGGRLAVRRLGRRELATWIVATVALWLVWSALMERFVKGVSLPYADGFVFAASVASQWLQARKVLENWIGWLIANTVAIGVFWVKEYYWFAVLYAIFWSLALGGWRAWRTAMAVEARGELAAPEERR